MSERFVMGGGQAAADNVSRIADYSQQAADTTSVEDESSVDKGLLIKLVGGVAAAFLVLFGGAYFYASGQTKANKGYELDLASRPQASVAANQNSFNPGPSGSQRDLQSLDIPGLSSLDPAARPSASVTTATASKIIEANEPQASVAAPNIDLTELKDVLTELTVAVNRMNAENQKTSATSDRLAATALKLTNVVASLEHKKQELNTPSRVARPKPSPPPKPTAQHRYIVKAKAGNRIWVGKEDDPLFALEIEIGSEIPTLGKVERIEHDAVKHVTTIVATYGTIKD